MAAVTVGGWIRSAVASSPRVIGPRRSIVAKAESCVGEASMSPSWRRRRARRVTARRSRSARSPAGSAAGAETGAGLAVVGLVVITSLN